MKLIWPKYQASGAFAKIADFMNDVSLMMTNFRVYGGGRAVVTRQGISLYLNPSDSFSQPFDIYDRTSTTLKVRGFDLRNNSGDNLIQMQSVWQDVGAGAGGVDLDTAITITETSVVALKYVTNTSGTHTVTIELVTHPVSDGSDGATEAVRYAPLWYIPFADSVITWSGVYDLRMLYGLGDAMMAGG